MPKKDTPPATGTKFEIAGVIIIAIALLLAAGLLDFLDFSVGRVGSFSARVLRYGFGVGAPGVVLLLLLVGVRYITAHAHIVYSRRFAAYVLTFLGLLALYHHYLVPANQEILPARLPDAGGLAGGAVVIILRRFFAMDGTTIFLWAWIVCALLVATQFSLSSFWDRLLGWGAAIPRLFVHNPKPLAEPAADSTVRSTTARSAPNRMVDEPDSARSALKPTFYNQAKDESVRPLSPLPLDTPLAAVAELPETPIAVPSLSRDVLAPSPGPVATPVAATGVKYKLPPLSLLKKGTGARNARLDKQIEEHARTLEHTLDSFGIQARVVHATQGPAVTRYELEPAPGVKISRIVSLSDDIALKLAAPSIRIEAPIPGKSVIGIEVPNREPFGVMLREVLESEEYQKAQSLLTVALGKDIAGQAIMADLAKMPHLLVAGATGSGKSICINILICSILFRAHPESVKFLLVDPKVVELSNYNGIPHLVAPVVTEPKKAASALKWTVQEMERRYALFAAAGVRDVTRYNEVNPEEKLPLIVVIIDELADLMMVAPVDVEDSICRLAQMARASGIHLVIATQRPSVDVITGTIKANIPSRISFAVSSQIDSRTILDMAGAEKLLGKGDMLFYPVGANKPVRLQGAFISDGEIEAVAKFIKDAGGTAEEAEVPLFEESVSASQTAKFEDDLLEDSVKLVLETGQASVSLLQRKFRIGYTRAARLVDMMEEMQIVTPANGSKPREVIMNSDQVFSRYFQKTGNA